MTSPQPIRVRPATAADIPSIARICTAAFSSGTIHASFWPEHLRTLPGDGDSLAWRTAYLEKMIANPPTELHLIVAVADDPSGKEEVVGFVDWQGPTPELPASRAAYPEPKTEAERAAALQERQKNWPSALDREAMKKHNDEIVKLEKETLGEGVSCKMWHPNTVAVDSRHRRKGIGTMIVQWGLDQAEKDGRDVCLISSTAGTWLYRKLGFETLGTRVVLGEEKTSMVWRVARGNV